MITIPKQAIAEMKAEIRASVDRFGYVEITGLVKQTLDNSWLFANNMALAQRVSDQPPYNDEYVVYRPNRERMKNDANGE
jgi:hypothetical protein